MHCQATMRYTIHMLSNSLNILKQSGHKITRVRAALLQTLEQTSTPLSIQDILIDLTRQSLKPNKTTIYREIEFFINQKLITEVDFGEGKKMYEGSTDHQHHIICVNCKKVKDVHMEKDLDKLIEQVTKAARYKSVGHSLEFFGLCPDCQKY